MSTHPPSSVRRRDESSLNSASDAHSNPSYTDSRGSGRSELGAKSAAAGSSSSSRRSESAPRLERAADPALDVADAVSGAGSGGFEASYDDSLDAQDRDASNDMQHNTSGGMGRSPARREGRHPAQRELEQGEPQHLEVEAFGGHSGLTTAKVMMAGTAAGVMEHVCMFPVDTIKTRLQAHRSASSRRYKGVADAAVRIVKAESVRGLYRGVNAVVMAAIPSHAIYFGVYEIFKDKFGGNNLGYHPLADGLAGGIATAAHDAIVTPLDVVKQRMQLYNSRYVGVGSAIRMIVRESGVRALFLSYPTTVLMNVPFMSVHFSVYESLKWFLSDENGHHGALQDLMAGAGAGALGGFVSNPLDVVKTRLQTQGVSGAPTYSGLLDCIKQIRATEPPSVFWKGTTARVLYFMPSAAISWTTYEFVKRLLSTDGDMDGIEIALP